jgi:DNA-binding response OmpR family regulator
VAKTAVRRPARRPSSIVCPRCKLHFVPTALHEPTNTGPRPTILVVGDEIYFRRIAEEALAPRFEVRAANSVADARRLVDTGTVDVLVVDRTVLSASSDGSLLRSRTRKTRPVLIYAAQDESEMYGESWEKLRRLGADDVVLKGMKAGEALNRKVSALLGLDPTGDDPFS